MPEFVFTMHNVRKKLGEKLVLDNVTMSFFEGAKIGVVGPNGAGKSTMLKLMAGMLQPDNGDVMLKKGATVGILLQEPPLTEGKTVMQNVEEAVADTKAILARYNEIGLELAEPGADYDVLLEGAESALTDLRAKGAEDARFTALADIVDAHNGLWCPEAEEYLLANFNPED